MTTKRNFIRNVASFDRSMSFPARQVSIGGNVFPLKGKQRKLMLDAITRGALVQ